MQADSDELAGRIDRQRSAHHGALAPEVFPREVDSRPHRVQPPLLDARGDPRRVRGLPTAPRPRDPRRRPRCRQRASLARRSQTPHRQPPRPPRRPTDPQRPERARRRGRACRSDPSLRQGVRAQRELVALGTGADRVDDLDRDPLSRGGSSARRGALTAYPAVGGNPVKDANAPTLRPVTTVLLVNVVPRNALFSGVSPIRRNAV